MASTVKNGIACLRKGNRRRHHHHTSLSQHRHPINRCHHQSLNNKAPPSTNRLRLPASTANPPTAAAVYFPFVNKQCPFQRSMPQLVTKLAIISNQAFMNGRCHTCFSSGLDKVETGYNLLME